ncbi:hypothetical protein GGQ85_004525, partial [Nitrobacter vulgaris]|nr:hypothetical protein [Nitrobacter vulgaris]
MRSVTLPISAQPLDPEQRTAIMSSELAITAFATLFVAIGPIDPDPRSWSMLKAIFSGILNPTEGGCHETEAVFGGTD